MISRCQTLLWSVAKVWQLLGMKRVKFSSLRHLQAVKNAHKFQGLWSCRGRRHGSKWWGGECTAKCRENTGLVYIVIICYSGLFILATQVFFMKYYEVMEVQVFCWSIQVGELDCATCLAFDIDKSPEPGWSPAEVETRNVDVLKISETWRIPADFVGNLWAHLSSAHDSFAFFWLLASLEAISSWWILAQLISGWDVGPWPRRQNSFTLNLRDAWHWCLCKNYCKGLKGRFFGGCDVGYKNQWYFMNMWIKNMIPITFETYCGDSAAFRNLDLLWLPILGLKTCNLIASCRTCSTQHPGRVHLKLIFRRRRYTMWTEMGAQFMIWHDENENTLENCRTAEPENGGFLRRDDSGAWEISFLFDRDLV